MKDVIKGEAKARRLRKRERRKRRGMIPPNALGVVEVVPSDLETAWNESRKVFTFRRSLPRRQRSEGCRNPFRIGRPPSTGETGFGAAPSGGTRSRAQSGVPAAWPSPRKMGQRRRANVAGSLVTPNALAGRDTRQPLSALFMSALDTTLFGRLAIDLGSTRGPSLSLAVQPHQPQTFPREV